MVTRAQTIFGLFTITISMFTAGCETPGNRRARAIREHDVDYLLKLVEKGPTDFGAVDSAGVLAKWGIDPEKNVQILYEAAKTGNPGYQGGIAIERLGQVYATLDETKTQLKSKIIDCLTDCMKDQERWWIALKAVRSSAPEALSELMLGHVYVLKHHFEWWKPQFLSNPSSDVIVSGGQVISGSVSFSMYIHRRSDLEQYLILIDTLGTMGKKAMTTVPFLIELLDTRADALNLLIEKERRKARKAGWRGPDAHGRWIGPTLLLDPATGQIDTSAIETLAILEQKHHLVSRMNTHIMKALTKIAGESPGNTPEAWKVWWEQNKEKYSRE